MSPWSRRGLCERRGARPHTLIHSSRVAPTSDNCEKESSGSTPGNEFPTTPNNNAIKKLLLCIEIDKSPWSEGDHYPPVFCPQSTESCVGGVSFINNVGCGNIPWVFPLAPLSPPPPLSFTAPHSWCGRVIIPLQTLCL